LVLLSIDFLVFYCIHCTLAVTAATAFGAVTITPFAAHCAAVLAIALLLMLDVVMIISIANS